MNTELVLCVNANHIDFKALRLKHVCVQVAPLIENT